MLRRSSPPPHDDPAADPEVEPRRSRFDAREVAASGDLPDLSGLAIAGLTRRRMAFMLGALLAVWIVIVFARQVGEASAATARAQEMAVENITLAGDVAAYQRELELIQRQRYIEQQARAYRIGGTKETAFTLEADAPPLPDDAPGSASVRIGARTDRVSPLDRWLTLLFGPAD